MRVAALDVGTVRIGVAVADELGLLAHPRPPVAASPRARALGALAELARDEEAVFATEGDGEAIVAAFHYWGPDAVRRLRGMFAFAIWDTVERSLFLARDPFGIKPLFLATGPGGTLFGSEKKSLLELIGRVVLDGALDPWALDPRAIEHYTVLQYVPEPETLHASIRRLESGTEIELTLPPLPKGPEAPAPTEGVRETQTTGGRPA